jgi:hypothetical protein
MTTKSISTSESTSTTPRAVVVKLAMADKLLLSSVQALVALAVVLAGKGLAAHRAQEGTLVGVGAEMGAEVVGSREAFGAQATLEGGRVLLCALRGVRVVGGGTVLVGEIEDVVSVRCYIGGRGSSTLVGGWASGSYSGGVR